jgi:hypothetical protein
LCIFCNTNCSEPTSVMHSDIGQYGSCRLDDYSIYRAGSGVSNDPVGPAEMCVTRFNG